jgi:PAS domain S-box-containing protein
MKEKDKAKEPLESELVAMRQRISELETILEENARLYAQAQQEITERKQTRQRLLAAERAQARRQAALFRLSADLTAALEETEVCRRVVDGLHDTLGYDHLVLWLVDETSGDRVLVASVGFVEPPTRIPPGRGLSERPLLDGQLHYTPDVTQDPRYIPGMGGAEVDVPVRIGGKVLGVLVAESKQPHTFSEDDFEVLTAAAQQAGLAIEKARLLAAERQRADELDALRTTMADITAELELSALLQAIVERAGGLLDATGGELGLYDEASQEIRIVVSHNLGKEYVGTRLGLGEGAMGRVAETGEPLIIEDYHTWEGRAPQYADVHVHASLNAPLKVGSRLVGAISIATADPARQFGPADLHLLNLFAQQAAIAIKNARLYADLKASQEYARNIIDSSLDPIIAVDKERRVVEFSKAAQDTFGYRPEEILGQHADVLYADPQEGVNTHQTTIEQGRCIREVMNRRKNGEVFPVFLSASLLRDARGELVGTMGVSRDITERKRAEAELRKYQEHLEELVHERTAELRESEERYRTLFDGVPVGLYRTTPAGQFMDANLAMVQMLGYPDRETLLATNAADLYLNSQDRVQWQALMEREGVVRDFEIRNRRYDGTVIWVKDTARAVRNEGGQVLYYEGSLEDITERKQAEAELRKYQEHLEELVEERTAELRESEERYRTLFDGVPVGLYRTTPAGQALAFNLALVQMLGYPSREAVLGITANDLYVDPEERVRWKALMEREGVVRDFEAQFRRHDGTVVWVNDTARAVRDEQGQVLYYEGSVEDITERKRFEEEIRRQKDYFEALFVNSPVAVLTADLDGNVVSWNPMAEKLFGYTQEEAIGKNADDLVANDDSIRAEAVGYTHQVLNLGLERLQVTTKRTRKDGSLVDVEVLGLPIIVAGEKVGYIAIYHDITERKGFEEEIRRQKEYFEALFVNSPVAVVTANLDGNVVSWNPMAEKLFAYTQEEAIGKELDDLVANDESIRAEAAGYTDQVINLGRVQATTKRTRKDGSLVDVELLALPVIVAGDKVGTICIYVDIADLQEARREAEAANQAKSVFLANMSHELRTPLNAILGFTQLMDRDPNLTAAQQENLGIINRSGEHLLALINEVLEMSKIEAGRVTLEETSFDLYRLLDGLEEMFGLRARDKGLALSFERAENVPQYVRTDEGKLRQVLSNLLGNAVKFTQEGGVALRVRALSPSQERETLHFEVEDTGPGIAPEELAVVFDPFVQATSGQQPQEGTGLGLSISRQYVRLMGGDLTVSSELGQGSLFKFDVQIGLADATEVQAAQPRRRVLGLEPNQPIYRLLVAEDKGTNRQLLVKLLEPLGFEVKEAVNGQEALEVWERWEPHLIWMDMRMPVMDGYEATRRIKATTKGQATVIIALTATAFEEDRERVLLEGCNDFVRKPFREDEIFDKLAEHLGVRFVYEEQAPPATAQLAEAQDVLTPAALAALPTGWVADLQQATVKADLNLILTLVDQIRGENPALADALADLAQNFGYKEILTLIEQAGG